MENDGDSRQRASLSGVLRVVVCVPALWFVVAYLGCAALRCGFPWELEWMEGGMITHAARVLRGLPIYAPPSIDFIAFFYTPLYPYLLAGLSLIAGGLSFALARSVSIAASLVIMSLLFAMARRERGWLAGVLAVGLYCALFETTGTFYDLARVDSLSLAFALAASAVAYYRRSYAGASLAALLIVAAFFTKQTSAIVGAFIGLHLLATRPRHALCYAAIGGGVGVGVAWWLESTSHGWFSFYAVAGHQGHAFYWRHLLIEYWRDVLFLCPFVALVPLLGASYGARWLAVLLGCLWIAAFIDRALSLDGRVNAYYSMLWYLEPRVLLVVPPLLMAALLTLTRLTRSNVPVPPPYFLLLYIGASLASALNHSTQWAHSNCFMPVAIWASLYSAMLLASLLKANVSRSRGEAWAAVACAAALLLQFGALAYDPRTQTPNAADRAALHEVLTTLDSYPAPVFIAAHPLYSYLRDGTIHAHAMGFNDVAFAGGVKASESRFRAGEFRTVMVDTGGRWPPGLKRYYEKVHVFHFAARTLLPRTGYEVRPKAIYVHR